MTDIETVHHFGPNQKSTRRAAHRQILAKKRLNRLRNYTFERRKAARERPGYQFIDPFEESGR